MSSSNKKTFKTSESTKTANTTVTSDAILLEPTTTDHVLVVTADSSANLTGNVDVELEMSPDGENWCPAKIKTTTTSSGTGAAIVGNEKFVDLSATGTGTDYKNNYARGRKTYNMSTNQLYTGSETDEELRTDAVDFMHHMIDVNKSFNYSGWYKTSEAPTTTYNPVLFRHGGHDPFENLKVVQTDSNTTTQNLCTTSKNNYAVKVEDQSYAGTTNTINVTVANNGTSNKFYVDGVSSTGALRLTEGATYIFDQSDSSNSGHPLRFSTTSDGTHGGGSEYTTGVTVVGTPGSAGAYTQITVAASAPTLYTYCTVHSGMGGQVNTILIDKRPGLKVSNASSTFINPFKLSTDTDPNTLPTIDEADIVNNPQNGIAISANVKFTNSGTKTNGNRKCLWRIYFEDSNGNPKGHIETFLYVSGSTIDLYNGYYNENYTPIGNYGIDSTNLGTLLNGNWNHITCNFLKQPSQTAHLQIYQSRISINGATPPTGDFGSTNAFQNFSGLVISKVELGGGDNYEIDVEYDNLCFYTGWLNTNTNWTAIYNARKNPLSFSSANMELKSCFVMGDGADDRSNHIYKDIVEPSSGRQFVKNDSLAAPVSITLTSSDDPYIVLGKSLPNVFDTSVSSSISGWFNTSDTGTLFSNTGGAAATGLKMEVTANNMVLTLIDSSQTITASTEVDDDEWHHLVVTKPSGTTPTIKVYIDGSESVSTTVTTISNDDLRGDNGFTLLGDGQNNASATSPAATDPSKLSASLSNWSLHSEVLDVNAVKQLYSNGHVRNIKNLPSVNPNNIVSWWKLSDTTTPEEDSVGSNDLQYFAFTTGNEYAATSNTTTLNSVIDYRINGTEKSLFPSLSTGTNTFPPLSSAWTITFWLYMPSSGTTLSNSNRECLLKTQVGTAQGGMQVFMRGTNTLECYITGTSTGNYVFGSIGSGFSYDAWNLITIDYDGNYGINIYANGSGNTGGVGTSGSTALINTQLSNATINNTEIMSIVYTPAGGTASSRANRFYRIDELTAYNIQLNSTQRSEVFNSGTPIEPTTLSFASNVESHFKFGDGSNDSLTNYYAYDDNDNTRYFEPVSPGTRSFALLTSNDSIYVAPPSPSLSANIIDADGAVLVENSINGNALTLSITKNFNFTTESWVSDASGEAAICLSFNGHEEQAEYFVLWKCNQTGKGINFLDGGWHNVVLSYRASSAEGQNIRFGPLDDINNKQNFNWNLSVDGREYNDINNSIGADYIGGLNTLLVETVASNSENTGFAIYNRHLKYDTSNNEETYKAHAQAGSNITEDSGANSPHAYQGSIDETSFHSQNFWVSSGGEEPTNFESEYPATIYGNTTGLSGTRGIGATYGVGIPYPLLDPSAIGATAGTSQYVNPNRYNASTNPGGGLEAWWRWGDTAGDCNENINDAVDFAIDVTNNNHDLRAQNFNDQRVVGPLTTPNSTGESIYLASQEASSGSTTTTLIDVVIEGIVDTACNVKDLALPVLQYLRVKFTGAGSTDLGSDKTEASLWYRKRRER